MFKCPPYVIVQWYRIDNNLNIQLRHRNLNIVYYFPKLFLVNILVNVPGHLGTKLKRNNRLGTKQTRNKTNKERSQLGTMPSRNKDR